MSLAPPYSRLLILLQVFCTMIQKCIFIHHVQCNAQNVLLSFFSSSVLSVIVLSKCSVKRCSKTEFDVVLS